MLFNPIELPPEIEEFVYRVIETFRGKGGFQVQNFADLMNRGELTPYLGLINNLDPYLLGKLEEAFNTTMGEVKDGKAYLNNPHQSAFFCEKWLAQCFKMKAFLIDVSNDMQRIATNIKALAAYCKNPIGQLILTTRQQALLEIEKRKEIKKRQDGAKKCRNNVLTNMVIRDARKAVAHILCGEIFRLDPVIGDAACEMRPPFILDMSDLILQNVDPNNLINLQKLGSQYILAWSQCEETLINIYENEITQGYFDRPMIDKKSNIYLCDQIFIELDGFLSNDGTQHAEFLNFCDHVISIIGLDNFTYLGLCKTMTTTRRMIYDRLGISCGDYQIDNLPPSIRGNYKQQLGMHSNRYIRQISHGLSQQCVNRQPNSLFPQLNNVLTNCNVELFTDDWKVPILPIYEGMRVITTYELTKGRPIVFVFNRMVIRDNHVSVNHPKLSGKLNLPNEITCVSFNPVVIMYIPENGRYVPVEMAPSDLEHRPCTVYECWSILNLDEPLPVSNDPMLAGLYSPDINTFIAAIKQCDIAHLMQLYAASHPPMGGRAKPGSTLNIPHYDFSVDGGLSCMLELHKQALSGNDQIQVQNLLDQVYLTLTQKKDEIRDREQDAENELQPLRDALAQAKSAAKGKKNDPTVGNCEKKLKEAQDKWNPLLAQLNQEYDTLLNTAMLIAEENILGTSQILPLNTVAPLGCITTINLFDEYISYRRTSMTCNMLFSYHDILTGAPGQVVYHIKLSGNDDTEFQYRYDRSIFFRISHILPSTYAMTIDRVTNVLAGLEGYNILRLIDMTIPDDSLDNAKLNGKDSYYRDDQ